MRKYEELSFNEQKEIAFLFGNWLREYTHAVVVRVLEKRDEIISNDFAMNLLKELSEREKDEQEQFDDNIYSLLQAFDIFKEYDPHNHPLTHARSYRDVLYDMYISERKGESA